MPSNFMSFTHMKDKPEVIYNTDVNTHEKDVSDGISKVSSMCENKIISGGTEYITYSELISVRELPNYFINNDDNLRIIIDTGDEGSVTSIIIGRNNYLIRKIKYWSDSFTDDVSINVVSMKVTAEHSPNNKSFYIVFALENSGSVEEDH